MATHPVDGQGGVRFARLIVPPSKQQKLRKKRVKPDVESQLCSLTEKDKREYRRIDREIREARRKIAADSGAQLEEPTEPHAEARARLVAALLATGWRVRMVSRPLQRRRPVLCHPGRSYTLSFYGRGVGQNDWHTLSDCRAWTLERLLAHCDERSTHEAHKRLAVQEGLDDVRAGVPGYPWELVLKTFKANLAAWFDEGRKRPPEIPMFETDAAERRYWAKHDVLVYFAEPDFLDIPEEA